MEEKKEVEKTETKQEIDQEQTKIISVLGCRQITEKCEVFAVALSELGLKGDMVVEIRVPISQIVNKQFDEQLQTGTIEIPVWLFEDRVKDIRENHADLLGRSFLNSVKTLVECEAISSKDAWIERGGFGPMKLVFSIPDVLAFLRSIESGTYDQISVQAIAKAIKILGCTNYRTSRGREATTTFWEWAITE